MQCVQFLFVLRTLRVQPLRTFQPDRDALAHAGFHLVQLARDIAQHPPQDRALTSQHALHALELACMRIAARLAAQGRTLPCVALPQPDAVTLGQQHQFLACHLQQPTIGRIGNRLFLHRGVHDHPRQLACVHRLHGMCSVDGVCQQLFHPRFVKPLTPARQRAGIARQARLEHDLASEKLPIRIFQPTLAHRLIGQVVGVFEVEQTGDQPHRQCRPTATSLGGRQAR